MKTEVYSWRVTAARKAAIEALARKRGRSVARLLDEAVADLIERQTTNDENDEALQQQMRSVASRAIGRIAGGDPDRAQEARERIRDRLRRRRSAKGK